MASQISTLPRAGQVATATFARAETTAAASALQASRAAQVFDPGKFARIQAALERQGVNFVTGREGQRLARQLGAEAMYWPAEVGRPGILIFGPSPTRTQVIEELIHFGQHKAAGFGSVGDNIVNLEIQAQNKLLEVGPRLGWTFDELSQIERARARWLLLRDGH